MFILAGSEMFLLVGLVVEAAGRRCPAFLVFDIFKLFAVIAAILASVMFGVLVNVVNVCWIFHCHICLCIGSLNHLFHLCM
ncbi:hypothetical protein EDC01DRAFT_663281 [Geopyxis carbonaria]|nr:hypothetical protein EDC01DRAFT_663281 [Geopyxis carbonaria]